MNRRSSSWTGRASRSLSEAFGPYCTPFIHEPAEPRCTEIRIVIACLLCLALGLIATYA